jgi:hypothetical protein
MWRDNFHSCISIIIDLKSILFRKLIISVKKLIVNIRKRISPSCSVLKVKTLTSYFFLMMRSISSLKCFILFAELKSFLILYIINCWRSYYLVYCQFPWVNHTSFRKHCNIYFPQSLNIFIIIYFKALLFVQKRIVN